MTAPTVTTTERTGYRAAAAELHRIADAIADLPSEKIPYVSLSILPDHNVDAVDAVALAVVGKKAKTERRNGDWLHVAYGSATEPVNVAIHATVPGPPDERDLELERLRAEVEALRATTAADATGLGYSREAEPDDPRPVSPGRVPLHTGAMVDGNQLVDETVGCE